MLTFTTNTDENGNVTIDMSIIKGENFSEAITIRINGQPLNLNGYNVKLTVAMNPYLVIDTTSGVTISDPANGIVYINIPYQTTETFTPGAYAYELFIISQLTSIRYFTGTFNVLGSISEIP